MRIQVMLLLKILIHYIHTKVEKVFFFQFLCICACFCSGVYIYMGVSAICRPEVNTDVGTDDEKSSNLC